MTSTHRRGRVIQHLKPGTYDAIWTWQDFTGDSRTITTSFVEEPASGPTATAASAAGRGASRRPAVGRGQLGSHGYVSFALSLGTLFPELHASAAACTRHRSTRAAL